MKTNSFPQGLATLALTMGLGSPAFAGRTEKPLVMAAVGDSISVAFDAWLPLANRPLSWSAGSDSFRRVKSHYHHLMSTHSAVTAHNLAVAGAPSSSVLEQMDVLRARLAGTKLDYLTVMVGANDVCSWPADYAPYLERYRKNIRETVNTARELNADVKVLLVPVPNMMRLYELGQAKGCGWKWQIYPMCNPLFRAKSPEERAAFAARTDALNAAMADVAAENADIARFADVKNVAFDSQDISWIDCFHPSTTGQQRLSDITWEQGWFQDLSTARLADGTGG